MGLFLFILLEAAYRWGLSATVATTGAMLCLRLPQAAIVNAAAISRETLLTRTAYLTLGGLVMGYIAGRERQHRDET